MQEENLFGNRLVTFLARDAREVGPVENEGAEETVVEHMGLPEEGLDIDEHMDNIRRSLMRQALEISGWNPDHIHDLREFDRETLQAELDWLEESADENDIVFLYVSAHGSYLRKTISWPDFFPGEWQQIPSHRRLLIVDSCSAAEFASAF